MKQISDYQYFITNMELSHENKDGLWDRLQHISQPTQHRSQTETRTIYAANIPTLKDIKNKTFNLADLTTVKAKSNPKNHPPRLNFLLTVQTRDTTLVHKILTETETYLFYYDSTFNLQNPPSSTLSSEDVVSPLAVGSG